jgi:uncharacterized protein YjbJ (UPF0337 family)
MSTSDSTVKGKWDEIAGKAKQAFGDLTGDQSTANSGAAQEVKGHGEQAWGSVKEAVHDSSTPTTGTRTDAETAADNTGHDVRNSVTSTAANVKDHIRNAVEDLKH